MKRPNNFPRERLHNPVTKDAVEKLARERPTLNAEMHYTIGGTMEAHVHSNLDAEREAAITNGTRRLHHSTDRARFDFEIAKSNSRSLYIKRQKSIGQTQSQKKQKYAQLERKSNKIGK